MNKILDFIYNILEKFVSYLEYKAIAKTIDRSVDIALKK